MPLTDAATAPAPCPLRATTPPFVAADLSRQRLLSSMMELSPVLGLLFRQSDLQLVYANDAAVRLLNPGGQTDLSKLKLGEVIGLSSLQQLQGQILPQAQVLGRWQGECSLRTVAGGELAVLASFTTHEGGREKPEGHLGLVAQPISAPGAAKTPGTTDHDLLNALLESVPDSIYFKDRHSRFLRVSRAMAEKDGRPDAAAFIGQTDFDRFTLEHAQPAYEAEQAIMRTGKPILDLEEKETWPDGHVTWVSTAKFPLRAVDGSIVGTFGISRDITAAKLAEAARLEMETQLMLAQKMESIGRLAAGVAHEVNTPTQFIADNTHFMTDAFARCGAVIRSFRALRECASAHAGCAAAIQATEAAEQDAEMDYLLAEIPRCLQQTLDGLARVARIVSSLKEFAHPNSPELAPADLNRVIETSLVVSRHEWKYVADVATELDANLPPVPCVVDEFNQVMLNLVINAAHAIGDALKQRGEARGRITVRTRNEGAWAVVEVEDSGTGIPPEIRDRIFDPFFTTKAVGKGTGQGLAIVHTVIVKHHRGTVDIATEPGRGTTFIVKLPLPAGVSLAEPLSVP